MAIPLLGFVLLGVVMVSLTISWFAIGTCAIWKALGKDVQEVDVDPVLGKILDTLVVAS